MCQAVPVYTICTGTNGRGLLDGLSMDSEPIKTCVFWMAPVGENPKFHYLESSVRSFLKSKGVEEITVIQSHPKSNHFPNYDISD